MKVVNAVSFVTARFENRIEAPNKPVHMKADELRVQMIIRKNVVALLPSGQLTLHLCDTSPCITPNDSSENTRQYLCCETGDRRLRRRP